MKDVGWKALAVNVSDVAAVGGTPRHALVTLFLPDGSTTAEIDELYDGLEECGAATGASVVGGDIVKIHGPFAISITLVGDLRARRGGAALGRAQGRHRGRDRLAGRVGPGAAVAQGGQGGWCRGGRRGAAGGGAVSGGIAAALGKFRRPMPRLSASRAIVQDLRPSSMIDISDGLVSDMWHVLEASKVGAVLDEDARSRRPRGSGVSSAGRTEEALSMALSGGEEYELLFTMSEPAGRPAARTRRQARHRPHPDRQDRLEGVGRQAGGRWRREGPQAGRVRSFQVRGVSVRRD